MKLLTVTIPCYNSQAYMEKCIQSLLPGGDRVQIIIIDDGSKDETGRIADEYQAKYPEIVLAIHQENGGHGAGINQGVRHAEGTYFKVVDSDDWVSEDFVTFLDELQDCENNGGADMVVTNYYYEHSDGEGNRPIDYENALPAGKIIGWDETRRFQIHQLLTIHSCTIRTSILRDHCEELPRHIFYEDNLMIYQTLPHVNKLLYLKHDLYRYFIGREGQSVQKDVMMRRYLHQMTVTQKCFETCHLDDVDNTTQRRYMQHELFMMFGIAVLYARLNRSEEADARLEEMWKACEEYDAKWTKKFRDRSPLFFVCLPGRVGQDISAAVYNFANKVVRFN